MEHQHFWVKRRKTVKGVSLTLTDHPKIKANGASEDDAEDELLDLICEHFGDGEPVLQYEERSSPTASTAAHLWTFSANEKLNTINLQELFPRGKCSRCGNILNDLNRSCVGIRKLAEKSSSDLAFTKTGRNTTDLLSDRLANLLLKLGLDPKVLAPAVDSAGSHFWEVLPTAEFIPFVPIKKAFANRVGATHCPKCKFENFGFVSLKDKEIREFVRDADWQAAQCSIRVAGPFAPVLIFDYEVKRAIEKAGRWKNLGWSKVGLASEDEIDRKLKFDLYPAY